MRSDLLIRPAVLADIPLIRGMADVVFRATYADILSPDQMEYMMDWMYSESGLRDQIAGPGRFFFVAESSGDAAGYVSYEFERMLENGGPLFHLQKLYVLPAFQGRGFGSAMVSFVRKDIAARGYTAARVELNVNRSNRAVSFYERLGMKRVRQGDFEIGGGYYMNDFIYAFDIHMTDKDVKYTALLREASALLEGEEDTVARMANMAALIHRCFGFWWTGFYVVKGGELVLGPFQGPVACMHIGFGKGVCGTAWKENRTVVVYDVEKFPGHIACSSESRSEIVVPVRRGGEVAAVLDIDSEHLGTFDATDAEWLEKLSRIVF